MIHIYARYLAGFFFLLLTGCSALQTTRLTQSFPSNLPRKIELTQVPFFPQEDYQCGPAALAMTLNAAGIPITPDVLVPQVYVPGRKGSFQFEMLTGARRNGAIAYQLAPSLEHLFTEVAAGNPVLILQNLGLSWYTRWHYAVVIGYDIDHSEVILHSGLRQKVSMPLKTFEHTWARSGYWSFITLPPNRLPQTADEINYIKAIAAFEKAQPPQQAKIAYQTALSRWPNNIFALIGLGNTNYSLKDLKAAEQAFRQGTIVDPNSTVAFNNLAHVLAEQGNYQEAITVAEKAVSLGGPFAESSQKTLENILKQSK